MWFVELHSSYECLWNTTNILVRTNCSFFFALNTSVNATVDLMPSIQSSQLEFDHALISIEYKHMIEFESPVCTRSQPEFQSIEGLNQFKHLFNS
jgi:hypothetical protein